MEILEYFIRVTGGDRSRREAEGAAAGLEALQHAEHEAGDEAAKATPKLLFFGQALKNVERNTGGVRSNIFGLSGRLGTLVQIAAAGLPGHHGPVGCPHRRRGLGGRRCGRGGRHRHRRGRGARRRPRLARRRRRARRLRPQGRADGAERLQPRRQAVRLLVQGGRDGRRAPQRRRGRLRRPARARHLARLGQADAFVPGQHGRGPLVAARRARLRLPCRAAARARVRRGREHRGRCRRARPPRGVRATRRAGSPGHDRQPRPGLRQRLAVGDPGRDGPVHRARPRRRRRRPVRRDGIADGLAGWAHSFRASTGRRRPPRPHRRHARRPSLLMVEPGEGHRPRVLHPARRRRERGQGASSTASRAW
jgi:hypothetical protein